MTGLKSGGATRSDAPYTQVAHYAIRLKGHLDPIWSEWFEGLTVRTLESGETILSGPVADQSALHGLLAKVRDLNLTLIAVCRIEPDQPPGVRDEIGDKLHHKE